MALFPRFVDLRGQPCLVAGGGEVALRRIRGLLDFGARLTVCAPRIKDEISHLAACGQIALQHRCFQAGDLAGVRLAVAATDDPAVNAEIRRLGAEGGIPVSSADSEPVTATGFSFPALVRRGDLVVGISSSGAFPALSRHVRERIDATLPPDLAEVTERLGRLRAELETSGLDPAERREIIEAHLKEMLAQEGWQE